MGTGIRRTPLRLGAPSETGAPWLVDLTSGHIDRIRRVTPGRSAITGPRSRPRGAQHMNKVMADVTPGHESVWWAGGGLMKITARAADTGGALGALELRIVEAGYGPPLLPRGVRERACADDLHAGRHRAHVRAGRRARRSVQRAAPAAAARPGHRGRARRGVRIRGCRTAGRVAPDYRDRKGDL